MTKLPPKVDLRHLMGPVKDQGELASSASHAVTSSLGSRIIQNYEQTKSDPLLTYIIESRKEEETVETPDPPTV